LSFGWRWHGWPTLFAGLVLLAFGCHWTDEGVWWCNTGYAFPWGLKRLLLGVPTTIAGCWLVFQGAPLLFG
jgi:hypothetical protein